jgi:hypothetical protein
MARLTGPDGGGPDRAKRWVPQGGADGATWRGLEGAPMGPNGGGYTERGGFRGPDGGLDRVGFRGPHGGGVGCGVRDRGGGCR